MSYSNGELLTFEELVGEVNHTTESLTDPLKVGKTSATNQNLVAEPSFLSHHPYELYYQYQAENNHSYPRTWKKQLLNLFKLLFDLNIGNG